MMEDDFDIMGNIKLIENYKTYLLASVADLFVTMTKGDSGDIEEINDELAEIIILSYLLSKRIGLDYQDIDDRILQKLRMGVSESNSIERQYGDYSKLMNFIKNGRGK